MPRGGIVVEPFRIHVADEVLNDLRARLRNARWPDQIPGIGWKQGTELDWLRRIVSYWSNEFDWRGWERRLNAFNHFTSEDIHFVHQRAPSGQGGAAHSHARLAQQFPRLPGHAADARAL